MKVSKMDKTPIVAAEGIRKDYGAYRVLKGVSFAVADGQGFGILGPNGAGKTTLFKCLTGEEALSAGSVFLRGRDISRTSAYERVRMGFGRTFQVARIFQEFTALENIAVTVESRLAARGASRGPWWSWRSSSAVTEEAIRRLAQIGLESKASVEARHLSHGDRKRLELGNTLSLEPTVLMLDEPTAGMSPGERGAIVRLIAEVRESLGLTLLMTEHDMGVMLELCSHLMVMNYGETIATGTPDEIRADSVVREVYLGQEVNLASARCSSDRHPP